MLAVNRRRFLSTTSLAFGSGVVGRTRPAAAQAPSRAPVADQIPVSLALYDYAGAKIAHGYLKNLKSQENSSDHKQQADAFRLLARHIAQTNVDEAFSQAISKVNPNSLDLNPAVNTSTALAWLKAADPAATAKDLPAYTPPNRSDLSASLQRLQTQGLSGHYLSFAEVHDALAHQPSFQSAVYSLRDAVPTQAAPDKHSIFRPACYLDKITVCRDFDKAAADTGVIRVLVGLVCGIAALLSDGTIGVFCSDFNNGLGTSIVSGAILAVRKGFCGENIAS